MFNVGGIKKENLVNVNQILANTNYIAISAIVDNTAKNANGMCLAGTPLYGDFTKRDGGTAAYVKETTTSGASNANCVLLHDIVFDGNNDANATILIKGTVQLKHMATATEALWTSAVIAALAANGINAINPTPAS